jgi:hypothetical protein
MGTVTALKRAPTVGASIDQLWTVREKKRVLESQLKVIEAEIEVLQDSVMTGLEAQGLDKGTGSKASVSISSSVVADVQDWEAFWAYILKNKYTHLLQRRVSEPAYRELLEAGKRVAGVMPFNKKRLTLRTLA